MIVEGLSVRIGADITNAQKNINTLVKDIQRAGDNLKRIAAISPGDAFKGFSDPFKGQVSTLGQLKSQLEDLKKRKDNILISDDDALTAINKQIAAYEKLIQHVSRVASGIENIGASAGEVNSIKGIRKEVDVLKQKKESVLVTDKKTLTELNKQIKAYEEMIREANRLGVTQAKTNNSFSALSGIGRNVAGSLAGYFAVDQVLQFGKAVIDTRAEFQKYEAVLTNTLGSNSSAQNALKQINAYISTTPAHIDEVTGSFVKLANRGVILTVNEMRGVGDVAAVLGKDFGQLTEAILDINNTERWTELGIKVKTSGDKIIGTFRGVTIEQERSERGALEMVKAFSQLDGVAGTTQNLSRELGGQLSNLTDSFTLLRNEIGVLIQDPASGLIGFFTEATKKARMFMMQLNEEIKAGGSLQIDGKNFFINETDTQGAKDRIESLTKRYRKLTEEIQNGQKTTESSKDLQEAYLNAINRQHGAMVKLIKADVDKKKSAEAQINTIDELKNKIKSLEETRSTTDYNSPAFEQITQQILKMKEELVAIENRGLQIGKIGQVEQQIEGIRNKLKVAFDEKQIARLNLELAEAEVELKRLSEIRPFRGFTEDERRVAGSIKAIAESLENAFGTFNISEQVAAQMKDIVIPIKPQIDEKELKNMQKALLDSLSGRIEGVEIHTITESIRVAKQEALALGRAFGEGANLAQAEISALQQEITRLIGEEGLNAYDPVIQGLIDRIRELQGEAAKVTYSFNALANNLVDGFARAESSSESFGKTLLNVARQTIKSFLAQALAAHIKNSIVAGTLNPFAAIALAAGGSAIINALFGKLPKFAEGGFVPYTPGGQLAIIGEKHNEYALPENKLEALLDKAVARGGGHLEFVVRGRDLVAVMSNENNARRVLH